jgi:succinate-acetate transporter protein
MDEKTANPAPLGLLGFGVTTILLNFVHNARLGDVDVMILAMGLAFGGLAQVVAGILEFKRGNTFGMVAFTSYGLFWWSFALLNMLPRNALLYPMYTVASYESSMAYFFMWGLFTLAMFFGTLKTNRALQTVFATLVILFFMLALRSAIQAYVPAVSTATIQSFTQIIGIEGVICGFSAFYLAVAQVLNEANGRTVLPIGEIA